MLFIIIIIIMAIENLQGVSYAVITPVFILATVSILVRIYARGVVLKAFDWDDWTMGVLLVGCSGHRTVRTELTRLCSSSTRVSKAFCMFFFITTLESKSKSC